MFQKVVSYVQQHQLLHPADRILVAVSGGADSVALLLILQKLGYEIRVAHCNFHLRGAESNRDAEFVERLSERLHVPCEVKDFNTELYARAHGLSIEMAARKLRYEWFEACRKEWQYTHIAVAHHREDNAETILLNLLRGTGIKGLCGIRPRNGHIIRPLLCLSREEIESFLQQQNQDYVTDSTNLKDDFLRNRIRHQVIPLLQDINPHATDNLLLTAENLTEAERMYHYCTEEFVSASLDSPDAINIDMILKAPSPLCVLHEALSPFGFSRPILMDILQALVPTRSVGKVFFAQDYDLLIDRDQIIIRSRTEEKLPTFHTATAATFEDFLTLCATHKITVKEISNPTEFNPSSKFAYLDKAKLCAHPVIIRTVQTGDQFIPFGMKGKKLVSDFLTDQKVNRFDKEQQLLLLSGDEIAWVIGRRTSELFRVNRDTTDVLMLELKD